MSEAASETFPSTLGGAMAESRLDGWQNLISGLGTTRDKAQYGEWMAGGPLPDGLLELLYAEDHFASRIVDAIPEEALRQGFGVMVRPTANPSEDEPSEGADVASAILDACDAWGAEAKTLEGAIWGRLFGLGALFIGADDGRDPVEPLNEKHIEKIDFIRVLDRQSLTIRTRYPGLSKDAGEAETYWLHPVDAAGDPAVMRPVHASRLIVFPGAPTTRRTRAENGGFHDSVLRRVYTTLRSCEANWQSVCHLMTDLAQAVFKIKGLMELVTAGQEEIIKKRVEIVDLCRSVARAIAIDADGESFERTPTPLTGVPELVQQTWLVLASAAQIPVTVLMGQSPTGFDATGESDLTWWYDTVRKYQRQVLRPALLRLVRLICAAKDGPTAGRIPARLEITFPDLWQGTPKDKAAREKAVADRDIAYVERGILTPEEVALARFGDQGWSSDTQIDRETRRRALRLRLRKMVEEVEKAASDEPPPRAPDPTQEPMREAA